MIKLGQVLLLIVYNIVHVFVASSPGGRNDRLIHTVMRMRLIFLMNIHKNHCMGGAC